MFLHNFSLTVTSLANVRDIQIVIITQFVVVSCVIIKRVNCIRRHFIYVEFFDVLMPANHSQNEFVSESPDFVCR